MALSDTWFSVTHPGGAPLRRDDRGGPVQRGHQRDAGTAGALEARADRAARAGVGGAAAPTRRGRGSRSVRCAATASCASAVVRLGGSDDDARLRGRDQFDQRLVVEAREMPGHVGRVDGAGELRLATQLIDALDFAELLPCGGDELLLLLCTTCVPSAAIARWRGSRFSSCTQRGDGGDGGGGAADREPMSTVCCAASQHP